MISQLQLLACATCRPAAGTIAAEAQDSAVLVMLACLAGVFTVLITIIFNFARRQRLAHADLPGANGDTFI
jgi:heme/copper-type cytochrome/quinol oxidase subunit 2